MAPVVPFGDDMGPSKEDLVHEFGVKCNASPEQALHYLEAYDWDFRMACDEFLRDTDQATAPPSNPPEQVPGYAPGYVPEYTGPRTLDGRPAPQSESSSKAKGQSKSRPKRTGIATLGSLGGSHSNDDGNDDSDETDHDDGRGNLFAGGEKSGLAVQDPNQQVSGPRKIINDILAKAKANSSRPEPTAQRADAPGPSRFHGTGVTLGGEGVESRPIPGPAGASTAGGSPQERLLHIWRDGFSIGDGELRRFDDPANQADLQMIRSGRAPLHLMDVESDQPVDVKLHQHDTPYKPPQKKYKPFSGSGQRLGSIVPGLGSSSSTADPSAAAAASSLSTTPATATTAAAAHEPATDPLQPTIMIRIQMPDGTRLPARFNTTDTIEDIYRFVRGASTETSSRPWVLATTFPNKEHSDQSLVLADVPEFKKGGTAVVKWVV
ncbi:hypothetical protein E4U50_003577 [Claviceps purpurea]|nr:hypothetical protein E4U50_003577 [Claviceps purpurea]